ncbi:nickel pincer cofactor biosynthesis protein LarB [Schlesneria paludicola]|uniref:nickel pincer cofactor biosynthesis protein LarB n=1 Tax=Schlesneria paludicola TaxID=360056 RepID=UPI00029B5536|nr:nickel pincer cofactor biosynthesis protein LarB [Schlesneria paludicola]
MLQDSLAQLLQRWQAGDLAADRLEHELRSALAMTTSTLDVRVDLDRQRRCGFPEVVYAPGKTVDTIRSVFREQFLAGQNSLATRMTPDQAAAVQAEFPTSVFNPVARTIVQINQTSPPNGRVIVVSAGTSDRPIAEEALETVRWMNCQAELILDVGVAGPQRLLAQTDRLATADAVVVVAGMEGALPSVVAGWVAVPVIAVPTSVGYGAHLGGFAPLLGMLTSCAANVAVVNIDAGFKGGYLAGLIARQTRRPTACLAEGS